MPANEIGDGTHSDLDLRAGSAATAQQIAKRLAALIMPPQPQHRTDRLPTTGVTDQRPAATAGGIGTGQNNGSEAGMGRHVIVIFSLKYLSTFRRFAMCRGLGRLQRDLFCVLQQRRKPMTFAEIRQAVRGNNPMLFVLSPHFERSVRRALLGMVRNNVVRAVGRGRSGDPYRYHLDPLRSAIPIA